ncbi:phage portal protein [Sedimentitalea sp. CY04]|uniref:Phage portal protein n=1 Tax=Parasedimentitalea denitrificans TaxID=2211118 RepID=A0ABX0WC62_9RHOB|nr:phage portal protein [Sedimentitalea sp. CY04]NIZ63295.1 phage portal protein [Sedimentitalea sp. CY04]
MIRRIIKAAARGIRNELSAGQSGWVDADSATSVAAGYTSTSGSVVNPATAMTVSAAWDCVKKHSQAIASLPMAVYERQSDGGKKRIEPDLAEILTVSPNTGQTAVDYWEGMSAQTALRGNGYSEKLFIGKRVVGMRPLFNVTPERQADGSFRYLIIDRGRKSYMPADKVFHMRGFGSGDGLGLSAIKYGANAMGAALSADEVAGKTFSEGLMASGVLQSEQTLDDKQREQLQDLLQKYRGSKNVGKLLTLEAGLSYQQLQLNPEDAQLLETRRFNVEDVCRWFGVPPIVIGHSAEGQTMWGSGVEAIMLSWLTLGINPQLKKLEAQIRKDLIPIGRRRRWFVEFNREALLQMDSAAKAEFLSKMASSATMTGNERRAKLNLPPHDAPEADQLLAQGAMLPIQDLGKGEQ